MRPGSASLATASSQSICLFCLHRPIPGRLHYSAFRQSRRAVAKSAQRRQHDTQHSANNSSQEKNAFPSFTIRQVKKDSVFEDQLNKSSVVRGLPSKHRNGYQETSPSQHTFDLESLQNSRYPVKKVSPVNHAQRGQETKPRGLTKHTRSGSSFSEDRSRSSDEAFIYRQRNPQRPTEERYTLQEQQTLRRGSPQRDISANDAQYTQFNESSKSRSRHDVDRMEYEENAPRRRSKQDKDRKESRRAQKFDLDEPSAEQKQLDLEAAERRARKEDRKRRQKQKEEAARAEQAKQIELPSFINVSNLATMLKVRQSPFLDKIMELGFTEVHSDSFISYEDASLIAMEYGFHPRVDRSDLDDLKPRPEAADKTLLPQRPPVVTIMGHVDHGKTTLLDYLRESSVAAQEHGGITQHIGAFSVLMGSGKTITFLDTPGHAAFLSMRERGANVTDIVILVVAADDSVKPQTIEAIKHAKAAQVPIIVAINKVDKEEAQIERVKQDLLRYDITVEDFNGDVQAYPVSGKTGQGVDALVEAIDTQAEILDMRAEKDGGVEGWVLETATTKAGRMATVLVRRGTLRPGDIIVAGTTWAKTRSLKNEAGVLVDEAPPGTPVEVDGWRDQPEAGDEVLQAPSEQKASSVVHFRESRIEQTQAAKDMEDIMKYRKAEAERREREKQEKEQAKLAKRRGIEGTVEAAASSDEDGVVRTVPKAKDAEVQALYFIVKADVSGSAEAIEESVNALPVANHPVELHILRAAVGQVSEFDVDHAATVATGQAFIVSFNQPVSPDIANDAERRGVRILNDSIIYQTLDSVRSVIESRLPPIVTKRVTGEAEAAQVFDINTSGRRYAKVAGCRVRNGTVEKGKAVRVFRGGNASINSDDNLVYDGTITTLKSHKTDVQEMRKGTECGMSFDKWQDFQIGDVIQCYEEHREPRRLL